MDDDELRRGLPTSHVKFGEDVAILAGDGLFAEAMRLFCEQPGEPARVLAALARAGRPRPGSTAWSAASTSTSIGEEDDAEGLRALHALKTGRLIAASVGVVLILEGRGEPETMPYRRFAGRARRPLPDRRRHPRRDRERRAARQATWKRRATWQTHLRQPLRPRAGARAGGRVPRQGDGGAGRGRAARPRT